MKKLIVFAAAILAAQFAHALTLSEIETNVRRHVDDTASSSSLQRYSDTIIDAVVNEAQREVVNQTWCVSSSTGYSLTAGVTYYALPTDFIATKNVIFQDRSNNVYVLKQVLPRTYLGQNPNYEKSSSGGQSPTNYQIRDSTSGAATQEISYIPVPTTSSTGTVRVDYYKRADDLSSDSDVPFDGDYSLYSYHDLIVYYTASRLFLMEGNVNAAAVYSQLYQSGLALMKEKFGVNPDYVPSAIGGR
jgi:hypothetical protein